ncbi:hypothetical protein V1514DRAFT_323370 [Lipomyces japonicus]|uniref:uncharacterized protein n=1 Tax=Lipomyces japonicus TaxID=56871 RepID=UPI0034CE1DD7
MPSRDQNERQPEQAAPDAVDKAVDDWLRSFEDSPIDQYQADDIKPVHRSFWSKILHPQPITAAGSELNGDSPADVFPDEMSCVQQFDEMVKCYGVGGQVRNWYRYGTIRDCNDRWAMFKFCIGTQLLSEQERQKSTRQFYKDVLEDRLKKGSSEDVWHARTTRKQNELSS